MIKITAAVLAQTIKPRPEKSHKGTFGRVAVIGGNQQYGGAAQLCSEAVVYSGAGLTTTITDKNNHPAIHSRLPEAMVLDWQDIRAIKELLPQMDVIVIGPGLGLAPHSLHLLQIVLELLLPTQYCIIDGSAITLFAENSFDLPVQKKTQLLFTPHEKEWERLSHLSLAEQTIETNRRVQKKLVSTVILKKHRTEIYAATDIWQNTLGTPAMATGGMGDTLAGILASFLAQFPKNEETVAAAIYLHSYIGEYLGSNHYVALPTKLIALIPQIMKEFEKKD